MAEDEARLHVINTCCVTKEAEAKSRQSVRRSLHGMPGRKVFVSGCATNLDAAQFSEISPTVTALQGPAEDVAVEIAARSELGCVDLGHDVAQPPVSGQPLPGGPPQPISTVRTRGFVKVQDGCDCRCSYCIIPKVRGPARSRSARAVLEEVGRRVVQGQREMVMTGISVGGYVDDDSGLDLGRLMVEVARVDGVERVRLSSVEAMHVSDSLIDALASESRICPHLHIPLQSGDDRVLRTMGRNYDSQSYLDLIQRLNEKIPNVNITTDVIVGFPTEDEAAFERTCELVRRAGITKIHTFSFSPRPGTEADGLGDPVSPAEKKRRSHEMRSLSDALGREFRASKLGTIQLVLVEKTASKRVSGYTRDYVRIYLAPESVDSGAILRARLDELYADGVRGTALKEYPFSHRRHHQHGINLKYP